MNKPPYESFPVLSGEKIMLRQIDPAEIIEIVDISFYNAKKASTESEALQMLAKINQDYLTGESIHWGIAVKSTNKIMGTCGFYRGFDNAYGELGCVLLPAYQGNGFMTNALQLSIRFGIQNIGLKKIIAITSRDNIKAQHLFERLGFIKNDGAAEEITYEFKNETFFY